MKYGDLFENVVGMGAFRDKKQRERGEQLHQARMEFLDKITMSTAAAIDQLEERGMSRRGAINIVADHLNNLADNIGMGE